MRRGFPDRLGVFCVDVLAVHRLTRLVTADEITRPARDAVIRDAYARAGRLIVNVDDDEFGRTMQGDECVDVAAGGDWSLVVEQDDEPPKLATLVTCRWCASFWIAAGVLTARRVAPRWWAPAAQVLAASSLSTFMARWEDE